jgi:hypothetical protein
MKTTATTIVALVLAANVGCAIAEPGTPRGEPSGLFADYKSYTTLEELRGRLPDRSTWQIITDVNTPPRGSCPRFHELRFVIPAEHLGHKGKLELEFINERLETTIFTPQDSRAYLDALRPSGVAVTGQGVTKIPPATRVSIPMAAPTAVMWQDERFANQVRAWIGRCS